MFSFTWCFLVVLAWDTAELWRYTVIKCTQPRPFWNFLFTVFIHWGWFYNSAEAVALSIASADRGSSQTFVHRPLLFTALSLVRSEAWGYMIKRIDTQWQDLSICLPALWTKCVVMIALEVHNNCGKVIHSRLAFEF